MDTIQHEWEKASRIIRELKADGDGLHYSQPLPIKDFQTTININQ
jgi:hypothetical protein